MDKRTLKKKITNFLFRIAVDILGGTPIVITIVMVLIKTSSSLIIPIKMLFGFSIPMVMKSLHIVCERDMIACGIVFMVHWCVLGLVSAELFRLFLFFCNKNFSGKKTTCNSSENVPPSEKEEANAETDKQ